MAVDLTALSPITTAATALSNIILVSPQATVGYQPQNPEDKPNVKPQPALMFHYEGEQAVDLESDITDHFVEDNTAIADQWALKPEVISTEGFIGELNDVVPAALAPLQILASKLTIVSAYVPVLSETAIIAYNEAFFLYQVAANALQNAVSSWNALNGIGGESVINGQGIITQPNQTKQQVMFQQFYGYWRNRTLFTVQTPWAVFQNMAIKSLKAIQDPDTRVITNFKVSFKMIRTASTVSSIALPAVLDGRASTQSAGLTDLGTSTPPSSIGLGSGLSTMGVA